MSMTQLEMQAMQATIRMAEEAKLIRESLQELTEELKRWRITSYPPSDLDPELQKMWDSPPNDPKEG